VSDAATKPRSRGILVIEVKRVVVSRQFGKSADVGVRDRFG
jgi:hypothetical protein